MLDYSREFRVLATHLNFTSASLALNLSQSSLSRHIADLETELGFRLLERNPVALTAAGKDYLESISRIIDAYDQTVARGRRIAQTESQSVSVAMVPPWNAPYSDMIYEAVAKIRDKDPSFSVRFTSDRSHTVTESVVAGLADVGIVLAEPTDLPSDIVSEWVMDIRFTAWVHEDNPVLKTGDVTFGDLAECSLVSSTNRQFSTWLDGMDEAYRKNGMEPKHHLKDIGSMTEFLLDLHDDEVLLGSDTDEYLDHFNPHLVELKFDDPSLAYSSYLIYPKDMQKKSARIFVDMCRKVAAQMRDAQEQAAVS